MTPSPNRLRIAVLFGGRSSEHDQEDKTQPNMREAVVNGCAVVHRLPARV